MKKGRKQQAIFSSIAGMELRSSPREPVPPSPEVPGEQGQEEILQPPEDRFSISLKLTHESIKLGPVLVGSFADRELTVENRGDSPCVLTALEGLPAEGFSLAAPPGLPCTLSPAGSMVLAVRFSPDSTGKKTARLSIRLGGHNGPVSEVQLFGEAVGTVATPSGTKYSPVFNSLDMSFVYMVPGAFIMGSPEDEPGRNQDEKQHEVTLRQGFYLQSTPVTHAQWRALMGDGFAGLAGGEADYPVADVSWHECQDFIKRLNRLGEGVYRLPTEAEWEYACRAGGTAALGDRVLTALYCEKDALLDEMAWYCGNSAGHAHPVALKNPNAWGLGDMLGNVMEWCQDWYGEYPAAATDPVGMTAGDAKVIRGGSWFSSAKNCRAAFRFKLAPGFRCHYLGFRLVKKVE
jgi:formylglycine-generating enzyme required for sulfatase activity